jgi:hypothetical protein
MTWWLVTWSTYGSWLPGDPRGFQTWRGKEYVPPPKRYAKAGEATYNAAIYSQRLQESKSTMTGEVVHLSIAHRQCVLNAVIEQIRKLPLIPAALSVSREHCHLLSKFGALKIRPTIGVLKGEATKALREAGLSCERIWSRECHPKSKREGHEFEIALRYVKNHETENAATHIWPAFQGIFEAT